MYGMPQKHKNKLQHKNEQSKNRKQNEELFLLLKLNKSLRESYVLNTY